MARAAIFVMIPVVALLVWRDLLFDRQLRALAYDQAYRDEHAAVQLAARDEVLDDAMWQLALGRPDDALSHVKRAQSMPAPTAMPERAWHIAAAASCALEGPDTRHYAGWRDDARVRAFCTLNKPASAPVKK